MRNYTAEMYKDLVEDIDDEILQRFMSDEKEFITGLSGVAKRTLVDLGAGHGRVEPFLASIAKDVVAIEINPDMYPALKDVASKLPNVAVIQGDFLQLKSIVPSNLDRPVFLILQNSLGTIEGGGYGEVLEVVINEAKERNGSLVLALLRLPALADWGVKMYGKLQKMVGNVDLAASDFEQGIVVTDTGYTSKWWTDKEIEDFKHLGQLIRSKNTDAYQFLEIGF